EPQIEAQRGLHRLDGTGQILTDVLGFQNRHIGVVELDSCADAAHQRLRPGGYGKNEQAESDRGETTMRRVVKRRAHRRCSYLLEHQIRVVLPAPLGELLEDA